MKSCVSYSDIGPKSDMRRGAVPLLTAVMVEREHSFVDVPPRPPPAG